LKQGGRCTWGRMAITQASPEADLLCSAKPVDHLLCHEVATPYHPPAWHSPAGKLVGEYCGLLPRGTAAAVASCCGSGECRGLKGGTQALHPKTAAPRVSASNLPLPYPRLYMGTATEMYPRQGRHCKSSTVGAAAKPHVRQLGIESRMQPPPAYPAVPHW